MGEINPSKIRAIREKMKAEAKGKTEAQRKGTELFYKMVKHMGSDGYVNEMKRRDDIAEASRKRETSNYLGELAKDAMWEMDKSNRFSLDGIGEVKYDPPTAKKTKIIFHADGTQTVIERTY